MKIKLQNISLLILPVLSLLFAGWGHPAHAELPLRGNDNPVLAVNASVAHDWSPGMQFLNLMKSARPWIGHRSDAWGGMTYEELRDGGFLDDEGWVVQVPDGLRAVGTVFDWAPNEAVQPYRSGRYVLRFEGQGKIKMKGNARIISIDPNEIVFEIREGKTWMMDIASTDPEGTGDYIRNISIVPERHLELYEAGAVFNPDWLALVEDIREFRFMDWGGTNNSTERTWDDRLSADEPNRGTGHALEDMVRLANEVGADVWFTMPHLADPDYLRRYAEYVRDHLDPRLNVRVEWSNEVWNGGFGQARWARAQSAEVWGDPSPASYIVKMSAQTARIWRDVFKGPDAERLQTVLAGQAVNLWHSQQMMDAQLWQQNEPELWQPTGDLFDALAVTSYFGDGLGRDPSIRQELLSPTITQGQDVNIWLADQLRDPENPESIPAVLEILRAQSAIARENGMDLVLYEGGQHVHSYLPPHPQGQEVASTKEELDALHAVFIDFVRSPQMAELYRDLWDGWATIGDGPFMQYTDLGRPGQFGSWGIRAHLLDNPPRAAFLWDIAAQTDPWWPSTGGPQYQQGVTLQGTIDADEMHGTIEEDYLIGHGGADLFFISAGRDGLHGGEGRDVAQFPGLLSDYQFQTEGRGVRVTGTDIASLLVDIEVLRFADGKEHDVTHLPLQ
jgi:hypothetical protein